MKIASILLLAPFLLSPDGDTGAAPPSAASLGSTPPTPEGDVFKSGALVKFKEYAADTPEDSKVFKTGDILTLGVKIEGPVEGYNCIRNSDGMASTAYFDEIESYDPETAQAKKSKKPKEPKAPKAPKPPKAPKVEKVEEPPAPLILTEAVKGLAGDNAAATLEAVKELSKQTDAGTFTLGGLLAVVNREGLQSSILTQKITDGAPEFEADGTTPVMVQKYTNDRAGFEAYATEETSCGYRKAMYLIGIYTKYTALGVTEEQIMSIGWTKAMLMLNVVSEENKDEMLAFAASHSKAEVENRVKQINVSAGDNTSPRGVKVAFHFALFNDAGKAVEAIIDAQALKEEGANDGEKKRNAFARIVTEWSQFTNAVAVEAQVATPAVQQETVTEEVAATA